MSPSGLPTVDVPAVEGVSTSQDGFPSDAGAEREESAEDVEVVRDPKPRGTLEEARSREHQMTHLPKKPFLPSLLQGENPTCAETEKVLEIPPGCRGQETTDQVWRASYG